MDQGVAWRRVGRLEFHGESPAVSSRQSPQGRLIENLPQTTRGGTLEGLTVVEQISIEMNTNISLKAIWEALRIN